MKDAIVTLDGRSGILASHLPFGDHRRGWEFRSLGRGGVNFEAIIRALNDIRYQGPLSVEWEDSGMDRLHGARESCQFVKRLDFNTSQIAFDDAFDKQTVSWQRAWAKRSMAHAGGVAVKRLLRRAARRQFAARGIPFDRRARRWRGG